jgi:hypothetical protein
VPSPFVRSREPPQLTDAEAAAIILRAREMAIDDLRAGRSAPYYAVPPMEPSQSNGVSPNSGDAARRGAVGGKRADHTDRDSAMSAVLAHLVGW